MATIISSKTSGVGGLTVTGDASGVLQLASANGTTAVTIDASQNVGIGTSSPSKKLSINGDFRLGDGGGTGAIFTDATVGLRFMLPAAGTSTTEAMRIDSTGQQSSTIVGYGTYNEYKCRAWVNFDGTGTVAIRSSGNVSSITDSWQGSYIVNFTTAMPDVNFAVAGSAGSKDNDNVDNGVVTLQNRSTSSVSIITRNVQSAGSTTDYDSVNVVILR